MVTAIVMMILVIVAAWGLTAYIIRKEDNYYNSGWKDDYPDEEVWDDKEGATTDSGDMNYPPG